MELQVEGALQPLSALPEPVRRWLRHARALGGERPRTVALTQVGELRRNGRLVRFAARQVLAAEPPGFLWRGSIALAPLVRLGRTDVYREGRGSTETRLLSFVRLERSEGAHLDAESSTRYLAELQWFPAAAVSPAVRWRAVDESAAEASMSYRAATASVTYRFDDEGRLSEQRARRRDPVTNAERDWVQRIDAEDEVGGVRIPVAGEAGWVGGGAVTPLVRWRVTAYASSIRPPPSERFRRCPSRRWAFTRSRSPLR